jgi:hypothetical protein
MRPVRSTWRVILSSLGLALLIASGAPLVIAAMAYVMGPPRANPDPAIFVIIAGLTLGPSVMLGIAVRRASNVSAQWDLGKVGSRILIFVSILITGILAYCGLYAVARFVELVWAK